MDTDKENINRLQTKSKIPLPRDPLHAATLSRKLKNSESESRHPLQVIHNQQNNKNVPELPGPSKETTKLFKSSTPLLKLDTRHVTLRKKNEDLGWDYKVFKDNPEEDSTIIVISDEDDSEDSQKTALNTNELSVIEAKKIVTPTLVLENSRVKNIKKSLKRPHSRELQGIPSATKKEKKQDDEHMWRRHHFTDRFNPPDQIQKRYMSSLSRYYTNDILMYLLGSEVKQLVPDIPSATRACVINWLMKVNGVDGDPAIVQTACWYLDTLLGTAHVTLHKLQLVASACYWISQKLHGPPVKASRLVKAASRAFSTEQLRAAEKQVLNRLKFPRQPVIPDDYITYFAWWCDASNSGEIEVAATFLCMSGLMVTKALCEEYPSVVGAAAVKNALILLKKGDLLARLKTCPLFLAAQKKSKNMSVVCSVQKKAVHLMTSSSYQYKAPIELYGCPPRFIAQELIINIDYELTMNARLQRLNEMPEQRVN